MSLSDAEFAEKLAQLEKLATDEEAARAEAERKNPDLAAERLRAERRQVLESAAGELRNCGVPDLLIEPLVRERVLETSSITRVRQWRRTKSWILVLHGHCGIGKDQAMAWSLWDGAVRRAEARNGLPSSAAKCWYTSYDLAALSSFDAAAERARVETMPELFIEDLGAETPSLPLLFNILNKRFANRRRTMATTNLNAEDFNAYAGKRIIERVDAGGVYCGVKGPNLRQLGFDGSHGLSLVGEQHRNVVEPEERERVVVRTQNYIARLLSPRARARRRQLELRFA